MKECPVCNRTPFEQKSWVRCPIFEEMICMSHCVQCDELDESITQPRCTYKKENSSGYQPIDKGGYKELTYHFRRKGILKYYELQKLRASKDEFLDIRVEVHTEYHIRMIHKDDFVLCRFLEKIRELEAEKIDKYCTTQKENEQ